MNKLEAVSRGEIHRLGEKREAPLRFEVGEIEIAQLCRKPRHSLILRHPRQIRLNYDLPRFRVGHDPFAEGE